MAKKPEAEDWIRALVALFGAGIGGGSAGSIISGLGGGVGGSSGVSTAGTGDKVNSIGHNFNYDLNYIPGPAQENHMLMQDIANEAILRQTPEEHMRALTKYVRPGMTPAEKKIALHIGRLLGDVCCPSLCTSVLWLGIRIRGLPSLSVPVELKIVVTHLKPLLL